MAVKANVLAYATVFHVAGILMALGGIFAFFVKESKRDFSGEGHTIVEI